VRRCDREAAIRGFEQRALESSHAAQSKESALADLAKDLNALRKMHAEVDAAPLAATERSTGLAKTLEDRDVTLQRAERKIEALEAKLAKQQKDALGERGCLRRRSPNSSSSSSRGRMLFGHCLRVSAVRGACRRTLGRQVKFFSFCNPRYSAYPLPQVEQSQAPRISMPEPQ
jgi:hypothetical protein